MREELLLDENGEKLFQECNTCYHFRYMEEADGWQDIPEPTGVCFLTPESVAVKSCRPACAQWKHYADGVMGFLSYKHNAPWTGGNNVGEVIGLFRNPESESLEV